MWKRNICQVESRNYDPTWVKIDINAEGVVII